MTLYYSQLKNLTGNLAINFKPVILFSINNLKYVYEFFLIDIKKY
jgi:hypothetical protein